MGDLATKIKELEEELEMSDKKFECKLAERLKEEVRVSKLKIEEDYKRDLQEEKKRILY